MEIKIEIFFFLNVIFVLDNIMEFLVLLGMDSLEKNRYLKCFYRKIFFFYSIRF